MVGQPSSLSVGAHGCAPFVDDRQDAGPTQDARRHQILFLFAITFENPYKCESRAVFPEVERATRIASVDLVRLRDLGASNFGRFQDILNSIQYKIK
jgi:hypothetical protein